MTSKGLHTRRRGTIVLFVVSILAGLIISEGFCRFYYRYLDENQRKELKAKEMFPTDRVLYDTRQLFPFNFKPLSSGLYRGIPIRVNSYGLRDREFGKKGGRVFRIIMIGDSIVFGHGLPLEDRIGEKLESKLTRRFARERRSYEVFNFGISGTTSFEHFLLAQRALDLEPDLVIWFYYLNDPEFHEWNRDLRECGIDIPVNYFLLESLIDKSALVFLLHERINVLISNYRFGHPGRVTLRLHEDSHPAFQCVKESIDRAGNLFRDKGVPAAMVVYPFPMIEGKKYPFGPIHKKMVQIGEEAGFATVDLLSVFEALPPRQVQLTELDRHPNGFANEIAAEKILEFIRKKDLLDVPAQMSH